MQESGESSLSSGEVVPCSDPKVSAARRTTALRISSLVVGCFGVGISYIVNAFNVFALALKEQFHLTQTKFEVLLAVAFIGLCASIPGGIILDRFGARWAGLIALVVSTSGWILVWSATLDIQFYQQHFYLLVLYFLIAGIGGGFTYIAATATNVRNFSERMRGTIVGILHACMSTGPAVIMVIYNSFFLNGHVVEVGKQNLAGFFIFLAASFGVINLMGICVYGHYPPVDPEEQSLIANQNSAEQERRKRELERSRRSLELTGSCANLSLPAAQQTENATASFFKLDYQLMFWPFIILTAFQMLFVQNLTIILMSFGEEEYTIIFPYLTPILGTIAKPLIGMFSDLTVNYIPRSTFIMVGAIMDLVIWLLSAYLIDYISMVLVATTLVDIAAYFVYALGPAILIERFGLASFSRDWGIVMAGFSIMTACLFFLFGGVYDHYSLPETDACIGLSCYTITFLTCTWIGAVAVICALAYFIKNRPTQTV